MGNTNKNGILKSKFVWAKGEQETMNCNLVFSTEIHAERKQNIRADAIGCFPSTWSSLS